MSKDPLRALLSDSRSYWVPRSIPETNELPDALSFLRDHVSQSIPLVIRGGASSWPAMTLWDTNYLRSRHGATEVSVSLTPHGLADAVTDGRFAQPLVERWPLSRLLDALAGSGGGSGDADCVPYYSAQDSSLTGELPGLAGDVDGGTLEFARAAFGAREAAAANVWLGDGRSVTTAHADPFENVYAVVRGRKRFLLRPPSDAALAPKPRWPNARWARAPAGSGAWELRAEPGETAWVDHSAPLPGDPVAVDLFPGDLLYLPALWLHEVRQFGLTMAVNWWFDMHYGRDWVLKLLFDNLRDAGWDSEGGREQGRRA